MYWKISCGKVTVRNSNVNGIYHLSRQERVVVVALSRLERS